VQFTAAIYSMLSGHFQFFVARNSLKIAQLVQQMLRNGSHLKHFIIFYFCWMGRPVIEQQWQFIFNKYCRCLCSTQTEYSHIENGRYIYRIHRSPMCEYMINFILKLKQLPEKYMMNSVLENFTVLQVLLSFMTIR